MTIKKETGIAALSVHCIIYFLGFFVNCIKSSSSSLYSIVNSTVKVEWRLILLSLVM